ncbi:MAG TPA: CBS domain-containing protein [Chloroflexi bacterium]|nr:CBS domain-containing protein [Chloroflexota bacterium]
MKAKDIMYTKVITVKQTATLRELNEVFQRYKITAVPVVDDENRVVGMVTEGDLIRAILPSYLELHEDSLYLHNFEYLEERVHHVENMQVKEIMTPSVISVTEDTPILKVGSIFLLKRIERIPVMRGDNLVGIISRSDIYRAIFGEIEEELEKAPREYRILVSLAHPASLKTLMTLATAIARAERGEVLALHVARRLEPDNPLLKEAAAYHSHNAPVHTLPRMGRDVGEAIVAAAAEGKADLLMLGWREEAPSKEEAVVGKVLGYVIEHRPCDLAIVRDRGLEKVERILVPTGGGPNAVLAARIALAMAKAHQGTVTMLYVRRPGGDRRAGERAIARTLANLPTERPVERRVVVGDVVKEVIKQAEDHDLVLIGATEEGFFKRIVFGNIPEGIARGCARTVVITKRRAGALKSWLRELQRPKG